MAAPVTFNVTTAAHATVMTRSLGAFAISLFILVNGGRGQSVGVPILPPTAEDYYGYAVSGLPSHFGSGQFGSVRSQDNTPENNPISNAGATLGRVLFYDRRLSHDNTKACASCHHQQNGFSDPNPQSEGIDGQLTPRHSMGLTNATFYDNGRFLSDESAASLEVQVLLPIVNPAELGIDLNMLTSKLSATSFYPELFSAAFGSEEVTSDRISRALAQFVRSMVSYDSKFDQVQQRTATYSPAELAGRQIFHGDGRCSFCHLTNAQVADQVHNSGLEAITDDPGAGDGKFKVASLRNAEVRGAYMHDGRFSTLEEIVEFYNSGVQDNPSLDFRLRDGSNGNAPLRLNLSETDKSDLVAFLKTLTDWQFLTDDKFSDPFVLLCDFNGDQDCGATDLDQMLAIGPVVDGVTVNAENGQFDLNADGLINNEDVQAWLADAAAANGLQGAYQPGDANLDGSVDDQDFKAWNDNRFQTTTDWSRGDFNGDGAVDVSDFNDWNQRKFSSLPTLMVPEPQLVPGFVLLLLVVGLRWRQLAAYRE